MQPVKTDCSDAAERLQVVVTALSAHTIYDTITRLSGPALPKPSTSARESFRVIPETVHETEQLPRARRGLFPYGGINAGPVHLKAARRVPAEASEEREVDQGSRDGRSRAPR